MESILVHFGGELVVAHVIAPVVSPELRHTWHHGVPRQVRLAAVMCWRRHRCLHAVPAAAQAASAPCQLHGDCTVGMSAAWRRSRP